MESVFESDSSPEAYNILTLATVAVLTPVGYVFYLLAVWSFRQYPYTVEPLVQTEMLGYLLVIAVTGVIAMLGWRWGLRVAPMIAVGGLLIWPWFTGISELGNVGYIAIPFVCVLFATVIEGIVRFPDQLRQIATPSVWRFALAGGLLHFVIGFGLQLYSRQGLPGAVFILLAYAISALALVAIGVLPVLLWARYRLLVPAIATAGWVVWGLYGTWTIRQSLPLGVFDGINWMGLSPYPDYLLKWPVLVVAVLVLAASELLIQRVGRLLRSPRDSSAE